MLFSSTNFGEQYFLFDDYYIPLYRYVKEKFSTNAFLIDLSVCSYGTYITSFLYMSPQLSISLFKMLIILRMCPIAAPGKSISGKSL